MPRILIVEDNEHNMKYFRDVLMANQYEVRGARDSGEALLAIREETPDLILMDVQLPDKSGIEVMALIREEKETATIPIIVVTAFAMRGDEARIRATQCTDYLSKPVSIGRLLGAVRTALAT